MRKVLLLTVALLLLAAPAIAQEMRTIAIDCWSGGHCAMPCGGSATGNYDCSEGTGSWTNGCAYTDPLPAGSRVTKIQAVLYTHQCAGSTTLSPTMNGEPIGTVTESRSSCSCLSSPCLNTTVISTDYPDGFPGYNVGGVNTFGVNVTAGVLCVEHVELTVTFGGKTVEIIGAPPSITNGSDVVAGCVQYREALEGVARDGANPVRNETVRFTSNRNAGGVTPDAISQRSTTTDATGHVSGELITRRQGAVTVGADVDPSYRVIPANINLLQAYYENQFRITAYNVALESDFTGGTQVTNPCGLTGTFYEAFLTSNRGVLMEGSGVDQNGQIITIDWAASGSPLNRRNVCFTTDTCARTASGACAVVGTTIAVDPVKIPMTANVNIANVGARTAQDTGGGINGYHIDNFITPGRAAFAAWSNLREVVTYLGGGPSPCN